MKTILTTIFILLLPLTACLEENGDATATTSQALGTSGDSVTITGIDASQTASVKDNYTQSVFSRYIYFEKTAGNKILVDYNFFPSGTDVKQQEQQILIPCEYTSLADDELLNINLSAPLKKTADCADKITVSLRDAKFTTDGLIFSFNGSLNVFETDFEFKITKSGFVDSLDGSVLEIPPRVSSDDENCDSTDDNCVGLEEVYDQIIAIRTLAASP